MELNYLQKINPHERDHRIKFVEDGHKYFIDGEEGYTSTTTWVHSHFSHFDSKGTLDKIMANPKMKTDPEYKYYGKTREEIETLWGSASIAGTALHLDIERYWNQAPVENTSLEYKHFLHFVEDHSHLVPFRTEWTVFHEEMKLSGSIDMIFEDPDEPGALIIMDWKNVKEIVYDTNFNKYGLTPFTKDLPDTNFWHYTLQLNVYKTILEQKYNKHITKLFLVIFHSNQSDYELIPVEPIPEIMKNLFQERMNFLGTTASSPLNDYFVKMKPIITTILNRSSAEVFTFDLLDSQKTKENKLIVLKEKQRQMKIGEIWQEMLGNIDGFINCKIGHPTGLDILSYSKKIAIELKNRTNTDNASSRKANLDKLAKFKLEHPDYMCIYATINDTNENKTIVGYKKTIVHNGIEIIHYTGMKFIQFMYNNDIETANKVITFLKQVIDEII